jgi:protein TonB
MFEDSLVESSGRIKTKRGWTTIVSFGVQICIVIVLVLIPLIYTEALPTKQLLTFLVAPPPPPPPPPPPAAAPVVKRAPPEIVDNVLRTPTKIPEKIKKIVEDEAPAPTNMSGVIGGFSGGAPGGVLGGVLSAANTPPPRIAPQRVKVSQGVTSGLLINKVTPTYPPIAKTAHITGSVVLQAVISKQGAIEGLKVVSGHPMLINSAVEAVKQWRYKPYILNGEPVEVETTVTVNFTMGG